MNSYDVGQITAAVIIGILVVALIVKSRSKSKQGDDGPPDEGSGG